MPLQATSGAASYDAFGGGVPVIPQYIEEVFSTYLYTGNSTDRTITNNIDLSTKKGLVWIKSRSNVRNNVLADNVSNQTELASNLTTPTQGYGGTGTVTSFNTDGFSLGTTEASNGNNFTFVSWTFRKQPKFFDVVTWSGDGNSSSRIISHNLGSKPGFVIIKCTSTASDWNAFGRVSDTNLAWMYLNTTAAASSVGGTPSYTTLGITTTGIDVAKIWLNSPTYPAAGGGNASGETYVAYLFAHDAGGFGTSGSDNVISCGSYTGTASTDVTVNLGYEPQWVMIKRTNSSGSPAWWIGDTMRGLNMQGINRLEAWASDAEGAAYNGINPTSTGFVLPTGTVLNDSASSTYIYIAIRRGPMKVPTSGTSVFNALSRTGTAAIATVSTTILPDLVMSQARGGMYNVFYDRLRGAGATLSPNLGTDAESAVTNGITAFNNTSYTVGSDASQNRINWNTYTYANWLFSRAPSFFDEVCWTGTGSGSQAITHNLNAVPEFTITKRRSGTGNWSCFPVMFGVNTGIYLDSTAALQTNAALHPTLPTSTTYYTNDASWGDENIGGTFVTYLFATCAGVSKVGSYTGNGTTQTINCGFTGGARFVLIKRTDSTGDWYVWDTARGIVSGNDPYLLLNSSAAEVTNTDYIDTYSAGFEISSTAPSAINASGGSFIFLAIS